MKLVRLNYYQYLGKPKEWKADNFTFNDINLVVGKNAVGKSRTLNVINVLAGLLIGPNQIIKEGNWDVSFINGEKSINYLLNLTNGNIKEERLTINEEEFLIRGPGGEGEIYYSTEGKRIDFHISTDSVAIFNKRDSKQHSFLDPLYEWGRNTLHYPFSSTLGQDQLGVITPETTGKFVNLKLHNRVVAIFYGGEKKYGGKFKQTIIDDMENIGYKIEDVGIDTVRGISLQIKGPLPVSLPSPPMGVYVKETDLKSTTPQTEMSQGMFRALSTLIQLNFGLLTGEPNLILIDDIGEGLDFERASSLISLLIEKAKKSSVQLIMATNDRFVMNKIPLEYWIILEREGGKCNNYDYRNSKDIFNEFELTGLSNFDFFSSNYYMKGSKGG